MLMMLIGSGVTFPVVASVVPGESQPPSLARIRRDTTKEGNVAVSPSQISSSGAEIVAYAAAPEREDSSNASKDAKASKTQGGGGATLGIALIALTSNAIAAVRLVASVMSFRILDLFRVRRFQREQCSERWSLMMTT